MRIDDLEVLVTLQRGTELQENIRLHRKIHRLWTMVCVLSGLLLAAVCGIWERGW